MGGRVPWEADQTASAAREDAYDLEAALSLRARKMAWSPWFQGQLPPPSEAADLPHGRRARSRRRCRSRVHRGNERVLRREGEQALQYGGPQGPTGLRDWLASDINRREGHHDRQDELRADDGFGGRVRERLRDVPRSRRRRHPRAAVLRGQHAHRASRACRRSSTVPMDDDGLDVAALEQLTDRIAAEGKRAEAAVHDPELPEPGREHDEPRAAQGRRRDLPRHGILIAQDDAYGAIASTASRCRRCSPSRAARARC